MVVPLAFFLAQVGSTAFVPGTLLSSSNLRRTYAVGDRNAYIMLAPETACGSEVSEIVWTGDGSHLVVRREVQDLDPRALGDLVSGVRLSPEALAQMRPQTEIDVWDLKTHKLRTAYRVASNGSIVSDPEPMAGTDRVIFTTSETVPSADGTSSHNLITIVMLAAGAGTLTRLGSYVEGGSNLMVSLSPKAPLGLVEDMDQSDSETWSLRFFGPSGTLGAKIPVPSSSYVSFNSEGIPGYVYVEKVNGKRMPKFMPIDPSTGRTGTPVVVSREAPPTTSNANLTALSGVPGSDVGAPTIFLCAKGGKPDESGLVTTDGTKPVISPKENAIAYLSQGSAMVRPLIKGPRAAFDEARLAVARSIALSNAKQVGLGFLMYSADMEDVLPAQGTDVRSMIGPYLKNDKLFEGFSYTFGGGNVSNVERPAETELGYVSGPGGRAVVYVDGHARWIPDAH